jgi:hypothetical protein
MDIQLQILQQANTDFTQITVDPQSGPDIQVTAQLVKRTLSVSKSKTVLDAIINVGGAILNDNPPNKAGTQAVINTAQAEGKELAGIVTDSDSLHFVIPIDIPKGHKCLVSFSAQIKTLTRDTGANEQALADLSLTWDDGAPAQVSIDNTSGSTQLKTQFLSVNGVANVRDHVDLFINRVVTTDGAILTPTTSEVTISNLVFNLSES